MTPLELYRRTRGSTSQRESSAGTRRAGRRSPKSMRWQHMRYDPEEATQLSQQALDLAHGLGDRHSEARIYWTMMLANVYGAKGSRQGLCTANARLSLARALDWREQMAYTLNDLAYAYMNTGKAEQASASATEARALWRELDNKPMLTDNLNSNAMLRCHSRRF